MCQNCQHVTRLSTESYTNNKYIWWYMKRVDIHQKSVYTKLSICNNSWFSASHMMMKDVLTLTYELLNWMPIKLMTRETGLLSQILANCNSFVTETVVHSLDVNSQPKWRRCSCGSQQDQVREAEV